MQVRESVLAKFGQGEGRPQQWLCAPRARARPHAHAHRITLANCAYLLIHVFKQSPVCEFLPCTAVCTDSPPPRPPNGPMILEQRYHEDLHVAYVAITRAKRKARGAGGAATCASCPAVAGAAVVSCVGS